MTYTLRPYQQDARYQINALLNGGRNPLFVSCTGSGKTKTSVQVIADQTALNRRLYVTVPQLEIFDQWLKDLTSAGLDPGFINDKGIKGRDKKVYVCMIDSLNNQLPYIPEAINPDIIVDDEAHLAAAPKYRQVHRAFPNARRYGMTGSPYRYDNKPLGDIFTDIVQTIEMYECQEQGYLAKTLIVVPEKHYSKIKIPRSGDEYDMHAQAELLGKTEIIGDFIADYGDIYAGKPVMVACCTTEHAAQVRDQFNASGWNFAHLHATLPRHERRKIIRQIRAEEINGVTTVGVGVLGLDIPGLYGVMWLTRTMSLTKYLQFNGRGLRAFPGKTHGIIYDPVGNSFLHGAPEMVRAWTLDGEYRPADSEEVPVMRVCPFCGVMNAYDNRVCHFCGKPISDEDGGPPRICLYCRHYVEVIDQPDCAVGAFNERWMLEAGCKAFEIRGRALPAIVDGELVIVEGDGQTEDIRKRAEEMKARQQAKEEDRRKQEEQEESDGNRAGLTPGERADVLKRGLFDGRRKLFKESIESFL